MPVAGEGSKMMTMEELIAKVLKLDSTCQKHESMLQHLTTRMEDVETYMKELTTELTKEMNNSNSGVLDRFVKLEQCLRDMREQIYRLGAETPTSHSESSATGRYENEEIERNCEIADSQYNSEEFGSYDRAPKKQTSKQTAFVPRPPPPEDSYRNERINQWVESQERLVRDDRKRTPKKRPRASVKRSSDAPKRPRQKRQSEQQDEETLNPARCYGCSKMSRKVCEVCSRYVCLDHRKMTIRCPDYILPLKDCRQDDHPVARNPTKTKAGRCVSCVGGKLRKQARTTCQTCGRFICKVHQNKKIRCLDHARDSTAGRTAAAKTRAPTVVDRTQPPSGFQESEVIDRIYP